MAFGRVGERIWGAGPWLAVVALTALDWRFFAFSLAAAGTWATYRRATRLRELEGAAEPAARLEAARIGEWLGVAALAFGGALAITLLAGGVWIGALTRDLDRACDQPSGSSTDTCEAINRAVERADGLAPLWRVFDRRGRE